MICGKCGFDNVNDEHTCVNCGSVFAAQQPVQSELNSTAPGYQPYGGQQNFGYQQMYQQYPYQNMYAPIQKDVSETVSTKEWVVSLLLMCIPGVNLILSLIWAFSDNEKKSKSNFFKAYLIMLLISFVISIGLVVLFFVLYADIMTTSNYTEMVSELAIFK